MNPKGKKDILIPSPKNLFEKTDQHVPIHLLHTQAYCEYQIYIEYVKGIEVEPTLEMHLGSERHESLDEEHKKKAKLELSMDQALAKSEAEDIALISREVYIQGSNTLGRIDEILIEPNKITIIDDKPNPTPYFTNQVQVWGYCHTFKEVYAPTLPIFGALRNEYTAEITWQEEFTEEYSARVIDGVRRIQDILSGKTQGSPTTNTRKCRPCQFKENCEVFTNNYR